MVFQPALNAATAGDGLPIEDYIALAGRQGFRWIELNGAQMDPLWRLGPERAAARLAAAGVAIASFFLPVSWRRDEAAFERDLPAFRRLVPFAAALGAARCCTYLFPNVPLPPEQTRRVFGRRFRIVAGILAPHGLRFGLEFLGPAHFRDDPGHTFLYRMEDMLGFAEELGPNVGLLVDSLHWHCLGSDVRALSAVPPGRLVYAHINDAPAGPRERQRDDDRLLPGDGAIDLAGFLTGLARAHYDGPVGIEVDGPALRGFDPDTAAGMARASWERLAARAGAAHA